MSGKKVIFLFYGSFVFLAFLSVALVAWLRTRPIVERQQREFAIILGSAYQKYHMDTKGWAPSAREAAIDFRTESPKFLDQVKDAETKWGMTAEIRDVESATPQLVIVFNKPQRQVQYTALRP